MGAAMISAAGARCEPAALTHRAPSEAAFLELSRRDDEGLAVSGVQFRVATEPDRPQMLSQSTLVSSSRTCAWRSTRRPFVSPVNVVSKMWGVHIRSRDRASASS